MISTTLRVTELALLTALLVACGAADEGGDGTAAADRGGAAMLGGAEALPLRDACELIDVEEVAALAGRELRAVPRDPEEVGRPNATGCFYETTDPDLPIPYVVTTVYWTGGAEEWRTSTRGAQLATKMMTQGQESDGFDPASVLQTRAVQVGDSAVYREAMASDVLQGDLLIEMEFPALSIDAPGFVMLARKALARLNQ